MEATRKEQEKVERAERQRQYMEAHRRLEEEKRRQKMIQERRQMLNALITDDALEDDASWRELRTKVHAMMA